MSNVEYREPVIAEKADDADSLDTETPTESYTVPGFFETVRTRLRWRLLELLDWVLYPFGRKEYPAVDIDEVERLEERLVSLNKEVKRLGLYDDDGEINPVDLALQDLKRARYASGHPTQFRRNISQAKRSELVALEQIRELVHPNDGWVITRFKHRALEVSLQADVDGLSESKHREVTALLAQDAPDEEYYQRISVALNILYQQYVEDHLQSVRGTLLESQLRFFLFVVVICLVALFAIWGYFFGEVGVSPTVSLFSTPFIGTVVLFGALGAAISSLMTLSSVLNNSAIPERVGSLWLAVSRVTVGAASALILYVFVIAELVNVFVITPSSLLAIAFVGGFTERLLVKAVSAVGGDSDTVPPRETRPPETEPRRPNG